MFISYIHVFQTRQKCLQQLSTTLASNCTAIKNHVQNNVIYNAQLNKTQKFKLKNGD